MWVYVGDSLQHWVRLKRELRFWLDYWLFLHGEDTHPIWSNRPLSVRAIAEAVRTTLPNERALLRQLKKEVQALRPLFSFLPSLSHPPSSELSGTGPLQDEWLRWLTQVQSGVNHDTFTVPIAEAIAHSLFLGDYSTSAFLTRRLASELSASELSVNRLFQVAKGCLCDSGVYDDQTLSESELALALSNALKPLPRLRYVVEVRVSPTTISRALARKFDLFVALRTESKEDSAVLKAMSMKVTATHVEEAALLGVKAAASVVEGLRLRSYLNTHLLGPVSVRQVDADSEVLIPLPQPFWANRGNRRDVPTFPDNFASLTKSLQPGEADAWNAAKWHISQAFSIWPEDAHAAAAHIWQGMEAFTGSEGLKGIRALSTEYLESETRSLLEFLALRINKQIRQFRTLTDFGESTWYGWRSKSVDLTKWLGRVLDERSLNCYRTWLDPVFPEFLFHPKAGLLQIASRRLRSNGELWMHRRVEADLALLYGLRNRVVHAGRRALPWQTAAHLGQLGAEIILVTMKSRARSLRVAG